MNGVPLFGTKDKTRECQVEVSRSGETTLFIRVEEKVTELGKWTEGQRDSMWLTAFFVYEALVPFYDEGDVWITPVLTEWSIELIDSFVAKLGKGDND